jgi:hypothetical protein
MESRCTTRNCCRVFEPKTGAVRTLEVRDVPPPRVSPDNAPSGAVAAGEEPAIPRGAALVTSEESIASASGRISLSIDLPPGYHLTRGANSRFEITAGGPSADGAPIPRVMTPSACTAQKILHFIEVI